MQKNDRHAGKDAQHVEPRMKTKARQLFASDMQVGQTFSGVPRSLDDQAFRQFSQLTGDDHPIHYDATYASQTRFGRQVAHGLLVSSMTALGATVMSAQIEDSMIAFVEQGFKFRKAALLDDVVTSHFTIESVEPKPERNMALVTFKVTLANQHGELLADGFHKYLFQLNRTHVA